MSENTGDRHASGLQDAFRVPTGSPSSYDQNQLGRENPILEAENLGRGRLV